ncbi:putative nuclease HARBI1 [Wyeomyia smithii]|uniref:putative nuclease HARBI1 n=1 Tax=Wyeomyia smithii TaxID=174621 RepID=UPI002467CFAC|nr:putative nuclease HARBI1 [Wyeomyia smithii]
MERETLKPKDIIMLTATAYQLLESSSSSDSDSGLEELALMMCEQKILRKRRRRKKSYGGFIDKYTEQKFREEFHVSKKTAVTIITHFKASKYSHVNMGPGRRTIPPKQQMLAFLWFCANKSCYRDVYNLFHLSGASFFKCLTNVLNFFHDFSKTVIKFPASETSLAHNAADFEKIAGIDKVLGCINASYFRVCQSVNKDAQGNNLLIPVQGVCDSKGRFMDVSVGSPSRISKSKVFALSPLSEQLAEICKGEYHLLGDDAYPLQEHLITPYPNHGDMTTEQKAFNQAHNQTRTTIDRAFATINQRFNKLAKIQFRRTERMCKFIVACCTLHNLCIDHNDEWELDEKELHKHRIKLAEEKSGRRRTLDNESHSIGAAKRNAIFRDPLEGK